MSRSLSLLALLAAVVLLFAVAAAAQQDAEVTSFLEAQSTADAEFESALGSEIGSELESDLLKPKSSGGGGVQKGGPPRKTAPNLRKGAADGSTLPPYDPFRIRRRWKRRQDKRDAARQAKVDRQNQIETCRQMRKRAAAREAAERREAEEEKRELAKEAQRKKRTESVVETDLMEVSAEVNADAETESTNEVDIESEISMEFEAEADMEAEDAAEQEASADAAEEAVDMNEMEADVMSGALAEVDAEVEDEAALVETDATPIVHRRKGLRPSSHVTYGREDLAAENFDNGDSRAVFKRRARGQEIVRFEKRLQSSGGQAVVNGVTKLPCGREVTDQGLFSAVVSENPGATVEAANPFPPKWVDDNIRAIKKLPVVPQFHEAGGVDEYGDPL